jgi:cobalamin-dependent methionine synthase I
MIIIGEKINATRKKIGEALEARDAEFIIKTAVEQAEAGADFIDINGGSPEKGQEAKNMEWLMGLVQDNTDKPIAVDSADPEAVKIGLSLAKQKPILNSISLESDRLEPILPLAADHDCMVVALLMSDDGTPCGIDDRLARCDQLVEKITGVGKKVDEIIVDPCFLPVSTDHNCGRTVLEAIAGIRAKYPEIHIGGGCSNISFGLPKRKLVNFALLSQAIYLGMDAGIIDPCIEGIMSAIRAAEAVAGCDEFCMNYVMAER